jgi:hypothetical protein
MGTFETDPTPDAAARDGSEGRNEAVCGLGGVEGDRMDPMDGRSPVDLTAELPDGITGTVEGAGNRGWPSGGTERPAGASESRSFGLGGGTSLRALGAVGASSPPAKAFATALAVVTSADTSTGASETPTEMIGELGVATRATCSKLRDSSWIEPSVACGSKVAVPFFCS